MKHLVIFAALIYLSSAAEQKRYFKLELTKDPRLTSVTDSTLEEVNNMRRHLYELLLKLNAQATRVDPNHKFHQVALDAANTLQAYEEVLRTPNDFVKKMSDMKDMLGRVQDQASYYYYTHLHIRPLEDLERHAVLDVVVFSSRAEETVTKILDEYRYKLTHHQAG